MLAMSAKEDILADLRANFEGECSERLVYLAMARVAHREGYPEVGMYYEKAALRGRSMHKIPQSSLAKHCKRQHRREPSDACRAENGATAGVI